MHSLRGFPWRKASLALGLLLLLGLVQAARSSEEPPKVFDKTVPETIQDLQELQNHVKTVLAKVIPATVGLRIGGAQGSSVLLPDGYVLTAGHVSGQPDRDAIILLQDGRKLKGKTLGANRGIDSGLIKITDMESVPAVEMGNSTQLSKGQWCIAIGHPGGFQAGRTPVVRVGRVLDIADTHVRTDCALVGGDSGGPLFDMYGRVIGIHSRIGGAMTANIHVPVNTYRDTWDRLAKGEAWGSGFGGKAQPAYLGITADAQTQACKVSKIDSGSPADKGGIKVDDVITGFNGQKIAGFDDLAALVQSHTPGAEVAIEVLRGMETVRLRLKLGRWPG